MTKKVKKVKFDFGPKFEVPKEYRDLIKRFGEFRYNPPEPNGFWEFNGGGYVNIGTDPEKVNEIKTPIEEWVERWINELGQQ